MAIPIFKSPLLDLLMQIRNLGGSGLRVSAVGLGCNNFGQRTDLESSRKVIHKAIDLGITPVPERNASLQDVGNFTILSPLSIGQREIDY